jgi:uncharacterized alkaline shock family protein YloU
MGVDAGKENVAIRVKFYYIWGVALSEKANSIIEVLMSNVRLTAFSHGAG